jgi:hypothetical protein
MRQALYLLIEYLSPIFGLFSFSYTLYQIFRNRTKMSHYNETILESNQKQSKKLEEILEEVKKNRKINL